MSRQVDVERTKDYGVAKWTGGAWYTSAHDERFEITRADAHARLVVFRTNSLQEATFWHLRSRGAVLGPHYLLQDRQRPELGFLATMAWPSLDGELVEVLDSAGHLLWAGWRADLQASQEACEVDRAIERVIVGDTR